MSAALVPVEVIVREGDCPCPGALHSDERIYIEAEAPLHMSLLALRMLRATPGNARAKYAALVAAYIPMCIVRWTFLEASEDGTLIPVEITQEAAERLIPFDKGGYEVLEKADALYSDRVLAPLVRGQTPKPLPIGPTADSTSQSPVSGSVLPKPSARSSPKGSAGKPFVAPVP